MLIDATFVVLAVLLPFVGSGIYKRTTGAPSPVRWMAAMLPMAILIAGGLMLKQMLQAPFWDHNAARLARVFAWRMGYSLYPSPLDGPLLTPMYGPVSAFVYLPATLARTPTSAVFMAALLTMLCYFGPVAWWVYRETPQRPEGRILAAGSLLAFFFITYESVPLHYSAFRVHADASALGLSALACAVLSRRKEKPVVSYVAASLCAVLAFWAKQTTAPLLLALPLYIGFCDGRRAMTQFTLFVAGLMLTLSAIFLVSFNAQNVIFNLFVLPAHQQWSAAAGEALVLAHVRLLEESLWPASLLFVGAFLTFSKAGKSWKDQPWVLPTLVGLLMMSTSLLNRVKIGGDVNALSPTLYFISVAAVLALAKAAEIPAANPPLAPWLIVSLMGALILMQTPPLLYYRFASTLRNLPNNPQETSYAYAKRHPGEAYFPWNPLSSLLAEGKAYHFEYGLLDRQLAGWPITPAHFRAYIPEHLAIVAVHKSNEFGQGLASAYLPDYSRPMQMDELPDWNVLGLQSK
jgi:hypothetical protein